MKIEMKDLRDHPVDLEISISPKALELEDPEYIFPENVTGAIVFTLAGDNPVAKGRVDTEVESECVRCLVKVRTPVRAAIDVVYEAVKEPITPELEVFGGADADERTAYFDGDTILPINQIREAIMLDLPPLPLCRPDCKGLCPNCGTNLNTTTCNCLRVTENAPSWKSALKNMKLE